MAHSEVPDHYWDLLSSEDPDEALVARHAIAVHYIWLVEGCARKLEARLPSYLEDEDLLASGHIGLMRAIDRYDPTKGVFSKFASVAIHGAILDDLRKLDWAPRSLRQNQRVVNKAKSELMTAGQSSTLQAVADRLGWDMAQVESVLRKAEQASILLASTQTDSSRLGLNGALDQSYSPESRIEIVCALFVRDYRELPPPVQVVLARIYLLNQTLTEVARSMGLSVSVIRRLHMDGVRAAMKSAQGTLVG